MLVGGRENWFVVRAPAKINLFLEVLARRSDGFHEIETLLVALDRCDSLALCACDAPEIRLDCRWSPELAALRASEGGEPAGDLPPSDRNLAYRAVQLLQQRSGSERGARVCLVKQVPAAAGLGGASSDAAAALLAANAAWNLGWSRSQLSALAAELGSDVPFFLGCGAAIARGRGEQLESVERFPPLHVVVVRPPVGLATPAVYQRCRPATKPRPLAPLIAAARHGDVGGIARAMHNQLQPAAEGLTPWIATMARWFAASDVLGHQMSGSGSSYFALCRSAAQARRIARRASAALAPGLAFAATTRTGFSTEIRRASGGL